MPIDPDTGREKGDGFMFEVGDRDPVVTGWGGQAGGGGTPPDPGGGQTFADFLALIAGGGLGGGGEQFGMGGMRRRRPQALPMMRAPIPAYAQGTPAGGGLMELLSLILGLHPGGQALVGEEGPEVVDLPPGSSVTPNPRTMPSYANGTPNQWVRQDLINRRRYGAPGSPPPNLPAFGSPPPPPGNNLPAGWSERQGGRPSDIMFGGMFGPNGNISYPQLLDHLTAKSIQGGVFDPMGSQGMAEMARSAITNSMGARERAATLGADMDSGGDPALRAFGRLQARLNTQGEGSNAYVNALMQSAQRNQEFLQSLFGARQGAVLRKDPKDNTLAQAGGQIGGAVLGGFIPG